MNPLIRNDDKRPEPIFDSNIPDHKIPIIVRLNTDERPGSDLNRRRRRDAVVAAGGEPSRDGGVDQGCHEDRTPVAGVGADVLVGRMRPGAGDGAGDLTGLEETGSGGFDRGGGRGARAGTAGSGLPGAAAGESGRREDGCDAEQLPRHVHLLGFRGFYAVSQVQPGKGVTGVASTGQNRIRDL